MGKDKLTQAKDCKCTDCKEQAEVFWPVVDPDIPSYPYCRKCVDKHKTKLMIKILGRDNKRHK